MNGRGKIELGNGLKIRKILVPTDFSDPSLRALAYALDLARAFQAQIILLHVMELSPYRFEATLMTREDEFGLKRTLERRIGQEAEKIRKSGLDAEGYCFIGEPHLEIVESVRKFGIDLVVMGTHGRSGLAHLFAGSTTEKTIGRAPCPVMVIGSATDTKKGSEQLFRSKGKEENKKR